MIHGRTADVQDWAAFTSSLGCHLVRCPCCSPETAQKNPQKVHSHPLSHYYHGGTTLIFLQARSNGSSLSAFCWDGILQTTSLSV